MFLLGAGVQKKEVLAQFDYVDHRPKVAAHWKDLAEYLSDKLDEMNSTNERLLEPQELKVERQKFIREVNKLKKRLIVAEEEAASWRLEVRLRRMQSREAEEI